jgi:hypothetical protein
VVIKRIGVVKAGVIQACVMALFGLIIGLCFLMFGTMLAGLTGGGSDGSAAVGAMGMLGGIGMVIFLPIMYGVMGFLAGVIGAAIYNLVAGMVGGLEIEVE